MKFYCEEQVLAGFQSGKAGTHRWSRWCWGSLLLLLAVLYSQGAQATLSGSYTIDGKSPASASNYLSFGAAIADMTSGFRPDGGPVNGSGISGPVEFLVAPGVYTEQVRIGFISGAVSGSEIIFKGAGIGQTILTYSPFDINSSHTLMMDNANHVYFKYMTIANEGTSAAMAVHIYGSCQFVGITGCELKVDSTSWMQSFKPVNISSNTDPSYGGLCWGGMTYAADVFIDSNIIRGGYMGVNAFLEGFGKSNGGRYAFYCRWNKFYHPREFGVNMSGVRGCQVNWNEIHMREKEPDGYGIAHCNGFINNSEVYEYIGNAIYNPGYTGIYVNTINNFSSERAIISNNYIYGFQVSKPYGIYVGYGNNFDVYSNTIVSSQYTNRNGSLLYVTNNSTKTRIKNNIFMQESKGAEAYLINAASNTIDSLDYNVFYYEDLPLNLDYAIISGAKIKGSNLVGGNGFNQHSAIINPRLTAPLDPRPLNSCLYGESHPYSEMDMYGNKRGLPPVVGCALPNGSTDDDIAVAVFTKPGFPLSSGNTDVALRVKNYGGNTVNSFDVSIALNGTVKTISFAGTLLACADTVIEFTGSNQLSFAKGVNSLKAWTSAPNGKADADPSNDTLVRNFCTTMSGTYTVRADGTGDFIGIPEAAEALACAGVSGPVVFDIAAFKDTGYVSLSFIRGVSAVNTVLFRGAGKDSTILENNASLPGSSVVFNMENASYITLEDIGFINEETFDAAVVRITNNASHITLRRVGMSYKFFSTNSAHVGLAISSDNFGTGASSYSGSDILVDDCDVLYSWIGMKVEGAFDNFNRNITIRNSRVSLAVQQGLYAQFNIGLTVENCDFDMALVNPTGYGVALVTNNAMKFNRNRIRNARNIGAFVQDINVKGDGMGLSEFNNNMIGDGFSNFQFFQRGMEVIQAFNTQFYHNTVLLDETSLAANTGSNPAVLGAHSGDGTSAFRNNIFVYSGTNRAAAVVFEAPAMGGYVFDNNLYANQLNGNFIYTNGTDTNAYSDLKAWQDLSPINNGASYTGNPDFVSPSDLHLSILSAPYFGVNLGVSLDNDGDARCAFAPSMGADESGYVDNNFSAGALIPDTFYVNAPQNVFNKHGRLLPFQHEWDLHIDGSVDHKEVNPVLVFSTPGADSVRLSSQNCNTTSVFDKYVTVLVPTVAPEADFVASSNEINQGQTVYLQNMTRGGATRFKWLVTPMSGVFFVNPDSAFNTSVLFNLSGTYQLCLIAENAAGIDTLCRSTYITVREEGVVCQQSSTTSNFGNLFDPGIKGAYTKTGLGGKAVCTYEINACAKAIDFRFQSFLLEATNNSADGMDSVVIYDGLGKDAVLIGAWSQNNPPNSSDVFTAKSGKAKVDFIVVQNNWGGTAPGFNLAWNSIPSNDVQPVFTLETYDTAYVNVDHQFYLHTQQAGLTYDLELDGDPTQLEYENATDTVYSWTYYSPGTYNVQVLAKSCGGFAVINKVLIVEDVNQAPRVVFDADRTLAAVGEVVSFNDATQEGPYGWEWEFYPAAQVEFINGTDAYTQHPQVKFRAPGKYSVRLRAYNYNAAPDDTASLLKLDYITVIDYCQPAVVNTSKDLGISRVQLGTLDNNSVAGVNPYTFFDQVTTPVLNPAYSYNIVVSRPSNLNPVNRKVWIDYNRDGDFDPVTELAAAEIAGYDLNFNAKITIPKTALEGLTRMRIATSFGTNPNTPCGVNAFGEFEDYRVYIQPIPDKDKPVITLLGTDTAIEVGSTYLDAGATAYDFIDGDITGSILVNNPVNNAMLGEYTVAYTVTDAAGNQADSVFRKVRVVDTQAPVITLNGNAVDSIEVGNLYLDAGATVTDNYYIGLTPLVKSNVNTAILGTYTVEFDAEDGSKNVATTVKRIVIVYDRTAPVITLIGKDTFTIDVFGLFNDPGVSISDNYYTGLTAKRSGTLDTEVLGIYELTYEVTDPSGNVASMVKRYVKVVDRVAPQIVLNGPPSINVQWSAPYTDAGATVVDNYDSGLQPTVVSDVDITTIGGPYFVTYSAMDLSGNKAPDVVRMVYVRAFTGVEEAVQEELIGIYPNPTNGLIRIFLKHGTATSVVLVNAVGQELGIAAQQSASSLYEMDLSGLAAGTYFVRVIMEEQVFTVPVNLVR